MREDLVVGEYYGHFYYDTIMKNRVKPGEIVVIEDIYNEGSPSFERYVINKTTCFTDEMIECIICECDIEEYKRRW